jgi:hypothetical protein
MGGMQCVLRKGRNTKTLLVWGDIMEAVRDRRIDSIIETLYDSFCGRSGQGRDWDKLRELFLPGARIYRADVSKGECSQAGAGYIEEIIETMSGTFEDNCLSAVEVARHTEKSGDFARVLSTYEVSYRPEDSKPFRRGKNRIRLYHDGRKWWIMSMLLCDFRCDEPLAGEKPSEIRKPDSYGNPQRSNHQYQSASSCA